MKEISKTKMKLYTFRFDINDHILRKQKPFWVKQKGFPIENNALDALEWFSRSINAQKQQSPKVI
jgi:hypothetical protein